MYSEYFGLTENPFSIAPDPRYLYLSEQHREALAHLLYGVTSDGGFVLLTGEVGTGKTTVCRCLLEQIPDDCEVAFIFNPKLTVAELLSTICDEFRIEYVPGTRSVKIFVDLINRYLLEAYANGRKAVLIIDEAQNLKSDVLEQIRLLTNLETNQRKLLQIILLGQPELREKLSRPELRQLAQRIVARFHLGPLSRREVAAYVHHRLTVAGARRPIFPDPALHQLHRLSAGIPRLINVLCDRAMLGCYARGKERVDKATLVRAAKEVFGQRKSPREAFRRAVLWAVCAVLAMSCGALVATEYFHYRPWQTAKAVSGKLKEPQPTLPWPDAAVQLSQRPTAHPETGKPAATEASAASFEPAKSIKKAEAPDAPGIDERAAAVGKGGPPAADAAAAKDPTGPAAAGTKEPPAPTPEKDALARPVPSDKLSWPTDEPVATSQALANAALLKQWGISDPPAASMSFCQHSERLNLACLAGGMSVDDLRRFNLPAVLKLHDEQGRDFYATLLELDRERARFVVGDKVRTVSIAEVTLRWLGDCTLLWRTPPGYAGSLRPGSRGPVVKWLRQALLKAQGRPEEAADDDLFDERLANRVKKFQLTNGLQPDGIVGPQTFILLDHAIDSDGPVLSGLRKDG